MQHDNLQHENAIDSLAAERYILGELRAAEREGFEEHFFVCPHCAQDVKDLSDLTAAARVVFAKEPVVVPVPFLERLRQWWAQPAMGLASACAILALTVATGYQSMRPGGVPEAIALESHLLRPETRGEIATIPVRSAQSHALLEADLPGLSGPLTWTLQVNETSPELLRGVAEAPASGLTLKLLLPAKSVAAGEYLLTIKSATSGSAQRFRFKTTEN